MVKALEGMNLIEVYREYPPVSATILGADFGAYVINRPQMWLRKTLIGGEYLVPGENIQMGNPLEPSAMTTNPASRDPPFIMWSDV